MKAAAAAKMMNTFKMQKLLRLNWLTAPRIKFISHQSPAAGGTFLFVSAHQCTAHKVKKKVEQEKMRPD